MNSAFASNVINFDEAALPRQIVGSRNAIECSPSTSMLNNVPRTRSTISCG